MQLKTTNNIAFFEVIIPAGISLIAVRGFNASKFLSNQRLKAMAALLAKIIQRITKINLITKKYLGKIVVCQPVPEYLKVNIPKKKPTNAKGIAKMVCENFTRDK